MSEYFFGLGPGHLSEDARRIAKLHGADLVNYNDPGTGARRHWFTGPNRGEPFDRQLAAEVSGALEKAGVNQEDTAHGHLHHR